ncbi:DUF2263 protein [Fadolivirus algeromassiliense]|jgi:hypothetical protein|uniref:DUF2263 protein n=1 Tax=Fadolivirus FV1/VV64 TaxID=3070911 RepID=A0A7D3UWH2_9VIRU|nr:DUF2263 protein [Fadolivirus algeromassiliense]QKF94809.1 DUF2263 protein [Fadolivirus FV1/VV64]
MEVTNEDTFDCVVRFIKAGYKPVALDFASGTNPGGAWRTSKQVGTQEESLCRRSNLGTLLEQKKYPMPGDSYYYIPKVIITEGNHICAIIASELRGIASQKQEYLIKRVTDVYECAVKNKHDVVVLGAWGCGAFKETEDDAEIMARIFKIVGKRYEDKIKSVFAVLYKKNYNTFKNILE